MVRHTNFDNLLGMVNTRKRLHGPLEGDRKLLYHPIDNLYQNIEQSIRSLPPSPALFAFQGASAAFLLKNFRRIVITFARYSTHFA